MNPTASDIDRAVQMVLHQSGLRAPNALPGSNGRLAAQNGFPAQSFAPSWNGLAASAAPAAFHPGDLTHGTLVEAVANAVMDRLRSLQVERNPITSTAAVASKLNPPHQAAPRSPSPNQGSAVLFDGRLFTEKHALALDPAARSLELPPGVVITPLAREHLKRAGVAIRWTASHSSGIPSADLARWAYAIELDFGLAGPLRRALAAEQPGWFELTGRLDHLAAWLAPNSGRAAVLLTPDPALAVYQAITRYQLRAASVADVEAAARACRSIQANLLAVDPAGKALTELRQICAALPRTAASSLPGGPNP